MTPEYYVDKMKVHARFARNYHPAQQKEGNRMLRIAVGPGGGEPRFFEWTETVMKAWRDRQWSWDIEGISLHSYTVLNWANKHVSLGFGEKDYAEILQGTLKMEGLVRDHTAIMDRYDPEKKLMLAVDEWGGWYAPLPGSNPGFLEQQNSLRDAVLAALNLNIFARHADRVRIANIAQMVNVLQAMILTKEDKMLLTPTYHVFHLYVPFQDATFVPVSFDAGTWTHGDIKLPRIDAIAARGQDGVLYLALTNVDPSRPVEIDAAVAGAKFSSASGKTLTAPRVDSVNTFEAPQAVAPRALKASVKSGRLQVTLAPKSVSVIALRP
jgi:alpha-N-arabinofuranosidase